MTFENGITLGKHKADPAHMKGLIVAAFLGGMSTVTCALSLADCAEVHKLASEEASHRSLYKLGLGSRAEDVRGYSMTYSMMGIADADAKSLAQLPFDRSFSRSSPDEVGRVAEKACQMAINRYE